MRLFARAISEFQAGVRKHSVLQMSCKIAAVHGTVWIQPFTISTVIMANKLKWAFSLAAYVADG